MDPELAKLAQTIEELSRRVAKLEQVVQGQPVRTDRPYVVPSLALRPNSSLESRLGAQYLNRAGVIALLVGIAFFLHWAFTNNWIGPLAVVILGFLGGCGLFALGEWFLRRDFRIFGLSLQGLGIAALYLTLWAAFQLYQLIPDVVAFTGMIVLTAATAFVAILRNSEALAVFAAIGGFGTPLLLSTGQNLELQLFAYVLVLCAGILATVRFRPWTGLLLTSFLGAFAISVVWFVTYYRKAEQPETVVFFCLTFAIFAAAPILTQRALAGDRNPVLLLLTPAATLVFLIGTGTILDYDQFAWVAQISMVALLFVSWRWCRGELRAACFATAVAGSAASIPVSVDAHWATSAIWLAYGVILMLFGFFRKLPFVRWVALVLLGITVAKVFLLDLSNLGQGYRILALSVLGVALLSLSLLYQRDWLGLRKQ